MSPSRIKSAPDLKIDVELGMPFRFYAVTVDMFERPFLFTLVRDDGSALRIGGFAHEAAPNRVVGSLEIERSQWVKSWDDLRELPEAFRCGLRYRVLRIAVDNIIFESGIVLMGYNAEITILPGEFPFSISIVSPFYRDVFMSEVKLYEYF